MKRDDFLLESSVNLLTTRWRFIERHQDPVHLLDCARPVDETFEVLSDPLNEAMEEDVSLNDRVYLPFGKVRNLEAVLPLTSTPTSLPMDSAAGHSRPRLSTVRPRGMLPLETATSEPSLLGDVPSRIKQALVKRAQQVKAVLSKDDVSDND